MFIAAFTCPEDTKCRHEIAPNRAYLHRGTPRKPQVELAKDTHAMALEYRIGHRTARTALGAVLLAVCLATGNSTYAASLKQDLNSSDVSTPTFTNPAVAQPVVPASSAGAKPQTTLQGRSAKPAATLPQTTPADTAAVVNKLLAPRQSDPNVPLPKENLTEAPSENTSLSGPKLYGRNESENGVLGAILGLRIPIPADRGTSGAVSTSSSRSDR